MFSQIFWLHCNTFECFAMFRVQFSTFFSVKSSCALVTREEMVISSQARFLPGRKLPFPPGWRVRMTISRKKIEISFGHRLYRVIQEYIFLSFCGNEKWKNPNISHPSDAPNNGVKFDCHICDAKLASKGSLFNHVKHVHERYGNTGYGVFSLAIQN